MAGRPTRVVDDQFGKPTYTVDLAKASWKLIAAGAQGTNGIIHVANAGQATWYDVAKRIFEAAGAPDLLSPCTTADYPTPAPRPKRSILDTGFYEHLTGAALPRWEDAIDRFLEII